MADMSKMLKQAQQMQQDMAKMQSELDETEFPYEGNGVKVVARGNGSIKSLIIDPEILKDDDKEMIEDCIMVAVNSAINNAKAEKEKRLGNITGGLNLPGLM